MVYRAISADMKERALLLLDAGYVTEDVCDILGVDEKKNGSKETVIKRGIKRGL
ncbi:hypothetical protein C8R43DRAFT_986384 [Mycena crocata]|nr:hypothetical protein C8R43DRAFT_986384 [Mycena crocata]